MMGLGHTIGAPTLILGVGIAEIRYGHVVGLPPVRIGDLVATGVLSMITAGGPLSPDCDNRAPLHGLFEHRYAIHWWGWPVIALALIWGLSGGRAPLAAYGPALGWLSHIAPYDWLFGKGGKDVPRGVPRWPWRSSPRHGLGLKVTGKTAGHSFLEWCFTCALAVLLVAELHALAVIPTTAL